MEKIDDFDVAILRLLQDDTRVTSETLAEAVGLSPTACQRRLKRLRESGAIAREVAVLDPDRVGGRITLIVQIVLERTRVDFVDSFKRDMLKAPEVQQCYYVTGEYDFVLIVTADDLADYEAVTQRLFFGNRSIQKFHTTVVMQSVKLGLGIRL